jgi:MYXO-CTERM domain-containing protein
VPPEICNGLDDDCDGLTDTDDPDYFTGPDASCPCTTEVCDDVDNDCDGLTDTDDPDYQVPTGPCGGYPATGECEPGHWECGPNPNNGNQVEEHCVGGQGPTPEVCDGLDNDCNGVTDDVAYNPPDCVVPDCTSGCCDGHWECVNGVDTCVPDAVGEPEVCDGLDNDCDLRVDEGAECPDPMVCFYGQCVYRIPPDGCGSQYAIEGLCVDDPCVAAHCEGGEICDPTLGDPADQYCYDPCPALQCTPPEYCDVTCDANGCYAECATADCYLDPTLCADGEICEGGQCVADACFGSNALDCGNQACRDGACVDTCVGINCDPGQECIDGQCVDLDCDSSLCPPGRVCVLGQCAQDPCGGVMCGPGRVCKDGQCVDDPCRLIVCPSGAICDDRGQCVEGQVQPPDGGTTDGDVLTDGGPASDGAAQDGAAPDAGGRTEDFSVTAGGGGGCNCRTSSRNQTPLPWVFIGLMLLFALRRRKR